jgi:PHD/YefM family antitoxin component YafN of YafNO toxin-antitoxin module
MQTLIELVSLAAAERLLMSRAELAAEDVASISLWVFFVT